MTTCVFMCGCDGGIAIVPPPGLIPPISATFTVTVLILERTVYTVVDRHARKRQTCARTMQPHTPAGHHRDRVWASWPPMLNLWMRAQGLLPPGVGVGAPVHAPRPRLTSQPELLSSSSSRYYHH